MQSSYIKSIQEFFSILKNRIYRLFSSSTGRDLSLVYSGKIIEAVIAMGASVLVARGLDNAARLGEVTLVVSFATVLGGLMGYGLDVTGVKFISDARVTKPDSVGKVVWNILVIRFLFIIIFSFLAYFVSGNILENWLEYKVDKNLIILGISISIINSLFGIVQSIMRGHRRFGIVFSTNITGRLFRFIFLSLCIYFGTLNVKIVLISNLIAGSVILFCCILLWMKNSVTFLQFEIDKSLSRNIFNYGFWMYGALILSILFNYMNVGMLSVLGTVSAVGYYAVAENVLRPFEFFPETLNQVFLPRMSEIQDRTGLIRFCRRVLVFGTCVALTLTPVIIYPDLLIRLIYGARYVDGAPVLRLLAGYMALNIILNPLYLFAHRLNLPRIFTFASAFSLCIGVSANIFLIPRYGELGCAMTMLIVGASTQLMLVPFIIRRATLTFPKSVELTGH